MGEPTPEQRAMLRANDSFRIYMDGRPRPKRIHSPKCADCRHRHDEHDEHGCGGNVWISEAMAVRCKCLAFAITGAGKEEGK